MCKKKEACELDDSMLEGVNGAGELVVVTGDCIRVEKDDYERTIVNNNGECKNLLGKRII